MPTLVDILKYQLVLDDSQFTATAAKADVQAEQLAGTIGGTLTTAVSFLAAAFGALKIGEFLKDATLTAARTEVLGTALSVVGKNAGVSQGQLALLEEQVKALGITTQEARSSIIKFIQSGLPLEKLAQLARLAQDSAVNAGINSSEAFERLARGIQTGQIELLRSAGVFVSIESELNKFARTSGKAREGLTDLERQTVILNAVLAQGSKLAGSYEAAMGDVGKQMTSLPRFFEEASNAIGVFFLPALEDAVALVTNLTQGVTNLLTNDAIQEARKFIKENGDAAAKQQRLNELYAEQERISANIAKNEVLIRESRSAQAAILSSGAAYLVGLGISGANEKLKRDLEEINKLIAALNQQGKVTIDVQLPSGPGTSILQGLIPADAFIDIPVKAVFDDQSEAFFQALLKDDFGQQQTVVFDFQLKGAGIENAFQSELDKIKAMWDRLKADIDAEGGLFSGPSTPSNQEADRLASLDEAARATKDKLGDAFKAVETIASSVFRNVAGEAGRVLDSILNSIASFSTVNIAGGIAGAFDAVFSIFNSGSDKIVASQRDLINAIEAWRQTVIDTTDKQKAEQERLLEANLAIAQQNQGGFFEDSIANVIAQSLRDMGLAAPEGATLDQLIQIMNQQLEILTNNSKSFDELITATTQQQRVGLVTGTTGADEALRLISFLTDIFDLNLKDQQELLQAAFDDLISRGLLSERDREEFFSRIEDLGDRITEAADTQREPTQTERSIARVTERQADTLISAISTMDLHLVEGLQSVVDSIQNLAANALGTLQGNAGGGTTITIGTLTLEGQDATAVENILVKKLNTGARAAGIPRIA